MPFFLLLPKIDMRIGKNSEGQIVIGKRISDWILNNNAGHFAVKIIAVRFGDYKHTPS